MSGLKRYSVMDGEDEYGSVEPWMADDEYGRYVLYTEAAALEAERDKAQADTERWKQRAEMLEKEIEARSKRAILAALKENKEYFEQVDPGRFNGWSAGKLRGYIESLEADHAATVQRLEAEIERLNQRCLELGGLTEEEATAPFKAALGKGETK